ncbi:MAG: RNA polymerase sigma factor [Myxococcota bacterium]|nr:RNA polymerase sigma factor [Myxococcota bacterium]
MTDAELLQASAEGDRQALGQLAARHHERLYRLARRLTRTPQEAEDALQEGFMDALRHAGSYAGQGSVGGWLSTLVRHAAYRNARRRAGEPAQHEDLQALGLAAGWGAPQESAPDRALIWEALERLAPQDREVLVLRELEGFTNPEVAEQLGLSLAATKNRIHRARLRLAAEVRDGGA